MPSVFDTLFAETATPILEDWFGVTVSIRRGTITTTGVTATKLNGEVNVNLDEGGYLQYYDAQWIVTKLRYTIAGVVVIPKKGDRIIDSSLQEWELTPLEDLAEVTERDGGYEWLIRTKRVKAL